MLPPRHTRYHVGDGGGVRALPACSYDAQMGRGLCESSLLAIMAFMALSLALPPKQREVRILPGKEKHTQTFPNI